jgi:hypothetical protein
MSRFLKLFKVTLIQRHRLYIIKTTYDMEKINQDTISHFYRILENSLLESDISKMNERDIDAWSQSFKKVVAESKEKSGKGVFVPFLMWKLGEISPVEASKYLDKRKDDECRVSYDHNNVEYVIWVMALMFMSWSITNLKRKRQNGHCQNINHPHGNTNPRYCQEGTKFHQELYNECVKTFEDLLTLSNSLKEEKL